MSSTPFERFLLLNPLFPLMLVTLAVSAEYSGFDLWWVGQFFDAASGQWPFREHWLFDTVLHRGGRTAAKLLVGVALILYVSSYFHSRLREHRKLLLYFVIATLLGPLLVSVGKHVTHIYIPWDLAIFQGSEPYIRLFDGVPQGARIGLGFPAGHASGGYAFLSLYFVALRLAPRYRYHGLAVGLGLGLLFGIEQQMRGAHFPSHDLFALLICWYAAWGVYWLFYRRQMQPVPMAASD